MKEDIELIEPTELYNLLNQVNLDTPCIAIECFLLLFDARKQEEYSESHVIRALHLPFCKEKGYAFPPHIDYSSIENIVVMDNRTTSLKDISSSALICARLLWGMGSKYPVKVVKGGFEYFSALYPYLRSQKILYTQNEIESTQMFPIEVIPGFLYMGVKKQADNAVIAKHLKIKAHVNATMNEDERFTVNDVIIGKNKEFVPQLLNLAIEDEITTDIISQFAVASTFIDQHHLNDGKSVLVYSELGVSRCTAIVLAYLMNRYKISVKEAVDRLSTCHKSICPNRAFIASLMEWEVSVLGKNTTGSKQLGYLPYE